MSDQPIDGPKGLGGWLYLFVLGLVISPIFRFHSLAPYWTLFRDDTLDQLTTPGAATYHHLWAPLLIVDIVGAIGTIVLGLLTLVYLLKESRRTPRLAILYLAWTTVFALADYFLADLIPALAAAPDPANTTELLRTLAIAAIWIMVSKRVKATFVE
jgi:Protein of unknown function (DUF2569)